MPAVYEGPGVSFEYPENWHLDEEKDDAGTLAVTVTSPSGAFWTVRMEDQHVPPQSVTDAVLDAMRAEYDELDAEEVSEFIGDVELVGIDMNFYCMDLLNTARVRAVDLPSSGSCMILCQAEDGEFSELAPVFQALTTSFLRHV